MIELLLKEPKETHSEDTR